MTTAEIRNSPSGPIVQVLVPPDVAVPDPAKFLNEVGDYVVPAGSGAVASVQGQNGITPTVPQTGIVVLDGVNLLPRDGSRAMLADLDLGGFNAFNGTFNGVNLMTGGGSGLFLNADGNYVPVAAPVTSVQGSDGITPNTAQTGVVVLSGINLLPLDGSRAMTGDLDMGAQNILNAAQVNGVPLTAAGSASLFLNQAGAYATPAGQVTSVETVPYSICITQNLAANTAYYSLVVAMEAMTLNQGSWDLAVASAGNFQVGIYSYTTGLLLASSAITAYAATAGVKTANFTGTTSVAKWDKFWLALWTNSTPQAKAFNAATADGIRSQQAGLGGGLPGSVTISAQSFLPWVAAGSA